MYVSQDRKLVFFHNPRTAGQSIAAMLGFEVEGRGKFSHMTAVDAKSRIFQDEWPNFFTVSLVRNPWDRMVAIYRYQRSIEFGLNSPFADVHRSARLYEFGDWLILNKLGQIDSDWFRVPQTMWTQDTTKTYKFENIEDCAKELRRRFHLETDLPRGTGLNRPDYRTNYPTQKEVDIVNELDSETIRRFGYDF